MKILSTVLRVLLMLLLLMPIAGILGFFPPPTAEMYTPQGWAFISALMNTGYMMPLLGIMFAVVVVLLVMNKTALAALLLAPITVNIMCFHWFLDAAPVSASSSLAYLLLILNAFFLWQNWGKYQKFLA